MENFGKIIRYTTKRENIILRQNTSDGIWVSFLFPVSVLISAWKFDAVSAVYASSRLYSFNLFLNVLHLLYHIISNKSLYVTKRLNILCAVPSCITIFLYISILDLDFRQSLCYTIANALIYFEGLPFVLKVFPNSFTFGEANLVVQGLSLFLFSCFTRLSKVLENVVPDDEYNVSTSILQIGHVGMLVLCIVPFIFPSMRSPFNMYIWIAIVIFCFITFAVNYVLAGNGFLWLWSFFINKERLSILALWLACSVASVWTIWDRVKMKKKADTIVRKYFHILADIVFISGIILDTNLIYFSSGCILAVFIIIEIFRIMRIPPFYELLQSSFLLYADEKDSGVVALTPIYLLVGYSIPLWLHPLTKYSSREYLQLLSGVLCVGVGDTCASIMGKLFGKHHWKGSKKTVEGTLACICGQIVFVFAVTYFEERATSDEAGEYGKISFPACTYWLFLALFHEYRDSLSPVLMELIQKNHHFVSPQDMDAILRKDAVYNAIGLAGFDLYDEVDFDQWFLTILLQELSIKEPNYRVIRRRVAWLMGQWASIKLSAELRPALYRAFIPLLEAQEDMAVRLSAASALKRAIDDFQFSSEQFMEFLEPTFSLLFNLLQEVEECDTKLQVLYVLSFIVERMGPAIKPYSQSLIRYLPLLWEQSSDHNMLRCAIVSILVRFVRGLITENLTTFLCPVIELCTDLNQDAHVYLLEEGLELWYAVLDNINSLPPQLLQLYRAMPSVLGFTREYLQSCGFIIQAYILLSPQQFLVEYGESLVSSCMSLLADLDDEGIAIILQVIDTAIRANASLAISLSMPMFPKILLLLDSRGYAMRIRPWLVSKFLEIICRVILFSRDIFFEVMVNTAREKSVTCEQFLEKVLSVWLPIMPMVSQKEKKKLLALGLSSLLPLGSDAVMAQFRVILGNLVEALNDIVDVEDSVQIDSIMASEEFSPSEVEELESQQETENDRRRKLLMETDPVYNVELKSYVQAQMNDLKLKLGAVNFEGLLRSVDPDTIEQCQFYIVF